LVALRFWSLLPGRETGTPPGFMRGALRGETDLSMEDGCELREVESLASVGSRHFASEMR